MVQILHTVMRMGLMIIATVLMYSATFAQQLQQRDLNPVDLDSIDIDTYYAGEQKLHVDVLPRFKGKNADFNAYILRKLKYPEDAYNRFIEGTVYVSYVIDTNGSIKDVFVLQSSNTLLDAAAVEVIMYAPRWRPARYKGKPVAFKKISKVIFRR